VRVFWRPASYSTSPETATAREKAQVAVALRERTRLLSGPCGNSMPSSDLVPACHAGIVTAQWRS
jgi:hypothetical protein